MADSDDFEILINRLRDGSPDDPDAGWQAAVALGNVTDSQRIDAAITALIEVLSSGRAHALIRAHAVESLGRLGDARALTALQTALNDPYRLVRAYATNALSRLDLSSESVDLLLVRLTDDFFGVRAEAAAGLGLIGSSTTDDALRQRIRQALEQRLTVEQANPAPGVERVIADIERSLLRLR